MNQAQSPFPAINCGAFLQEGEENAYRRFGDTVRAIHPQAKAWGFLAHAILKNSIG